MNKIILNYLKTSIYNIGHNRTYTLFYCAGTAITFVFIIIILQISHLITHVEPPFINAARTIHLEDFSAKNGQYLGGISLQEMNLLLKNTQGTETYSISNTESINAKINGKFKPISANFVNAEYFDINAFDFMLGRAFSEEDITNRKPYAVITKYIADKYFQRDALDKKMIIQEIEYQVIGVVDNYSSLLNPHENANIWLPYIYNKFVPSCKYYYSLDILFSPDMQVSSMKENLFHSLIQCFNTRNVDIDLNKNNIQTIQEEKYKLLSGNRLTYGIAAFIVLLLIVPAINIMTLNLSNVNNRAQEIAMRRAIGAGKFSSFFQILFENFILVCFGLIIALILIYPTITLIESVFFSTYSVPVLTSTEIKLPVIIVTMVLAILYTILAGAIPAYSISNKNIPNTLKGGIR